MQIKTATPILGVAVWIVGDFSQQMGSAHIRCAIMHKLREIQESCQFDDMNPLLMKESDKLGIIVKVIVFRNDVRGASNEGHLDQVIIVGVTADRQTPWNFHPH